ncbi:MAG: Ig-like domain-containing protein [Methylococcales bacterium]
MQNKHKSLKPISTALLLAGCALAQQTAMAVLPAKPVLNFTDGVNGCVINGIYPACAHNVTTVSPGSYFAMDLNATGFIPSTRVAMISTGTGVTLETAQGIGEIDFDWIFGGPLGRHVTLNALVPTSTGANTYNVNMTGWTVNWGAEGNIDMGAGAAATLTCAVDCTLNDTYTLDYQAVVPSGAFSGVPYALHLEGIIGTANTAPVSNNVNFADVPSTFHTWTPDVSDGDTPADTLTCNVTSAGSQGATIAVLSDCSSGTYTPAAGAGFTGTDSFTYKVNDAYIDSNPHGTVSINITANPPAICQNLSSSAIAGASSTITIDVTDTNVCTIGNGSIVASTLAVSNPSANNGSVTVDTITGIVTYTPAAGFAGTDTFTYTVENNNAVASTPAIVAMTVLTSSAGSPPSSPDGTVVCGTTADAAGNTACVVSMANIGVEDNGFDREQGIAQSCVGGCFDFTVSGLTAGDDARVVLPLSIAIPSATTSNAGHKIVYRKLMSTGWKDFDTSGNNSLASTAGTLNGTDVECPAADDASYINGLTPGDRCVRMTITDGGPNDADGLANGTVVDPGGISETFFTSGTDGCSMSATPVNARERADWWFVAGFLGLLGLLRLTRNKA